MKLRNLISFFKKETKDQKLEKQLLNKKLDYNYGVQVATKLVVHIRLLKINNIEHTQFIDKIITDTQISIKKSGKSNSFICGFNSVILNNVFPTVAEEIKYPTSTYGSEFNEIVYDLYK